MRRIRLRHRQLSRLVAYHSARAGMRTGATFSPCVCDLCKYAYYEMKRLRVAHNGEL